MRLIWHGLVGGVAAAALHTLLLLYTVVQIVYATDANWPGFWIKFLALDFPLSLGVVPLAWIFPASNAGRLHDFANFWWPLGYHGSIGTLWWYIIGKFIATRFARRFAHADDGTQS